MLLSEPAPTQADIHFRLFNIPVRIHPFFWVISVLLGMSGGSTPPVNMLVWIGVVFVSILVHELGHAVLQRRFGGHPRITLHGMGGLAICGDCDRSPRSQILISLAGPLAGFALVALLLIALQVAGNQAGWVVSGEFLSESPEMAGLYQIPILGTVFYWQPFESGVANLLVANLIWINVLWGCVNLLPIYPLDGGQISREICQMGHPSKGIVLSLQISFVFAVLMVFVGLSWGSLYVALMFGFFAYSSYQNLQAYRSSRW